MWHRYGNSHINAINYPFYCFGVDEISQKICIRETASKLASGCINRAIKVLKKIMRIGRNKSLNTVIGFTYLLGEDFVASHCTVAVALHWSNKFKINYECNWYSDDELQVKKRIWFAVRNWYTKDGVLMLRNDLCLFDFSDQSALRLTAIHYS